jgi:D-alanyl-D-alanine carboxypeptidase
MAAVRVALIDDHTMFREGLLSILSSREGIEVVGDSPAGDEALSLLRDEGPDVVLTQIDMDLNAAKGILARVREASPDSKIVVLTIFDNLRYVQALSGLGVDAYVHKSSSAEELVATIDALTRDPEGGTRWSLCRAALWSGWAKGPWARSPSGRRRSWCSWPAASPTTGSPPSSTSQTPSQTPPSSATWPTSTRRWGGLLSLDDPIDKIDKYVKGVPNGDKITLRQMSDMTSGLDSYTDDEQWVKEWLSDPTGVWNPEDLARIAIKEFPLFEPGTGWFYSNTNYVLLGLVLEKVTGEPIGQLYQKEIIEPLDLNETSFPDADSSLPEPHDHGYTLQGKSSAAQPVDATNWNPSWTWTAGEMISTVDDLLVDGQALGTGKGLLSPEQQSVRLDSFVSDVPPLNKPPLKGDQAYGLGLGNDHGWIGHDGEIPGYNTYLFYNSDLDAVVVEVNSDISSGKCPKNVPIMKEWPRTIPCELPADRIFEALAEALGKPSPSPPE